MLVLLAGMRRGKILALKWEHVELARGMLAVKQTLSRGKEGTLFFGRCFRLCSLTYHRVYGHSPWRSLEAEAGGQGLGQMPKRYYALSCIIG